MLEILRGDRPRKQYGAGYYFVHRADLHALLVQTVLSNDPNAIALGAKLDSVEPREDGAKAIFAGGRIVECDVLIGADGVRSAVRASAFEKTGAKFTGHVAWRGLVPRERLALPKPCSIPRRAFTSGRASSSCATRCGMAP